MGRFVKSAAPPGIALSHFCYRRRKTLAPQGPRKLPKLDVAGSTPVARSRESADFSRPSEVQREKPGRRASLGAGDVNGRARVALGECWASQAPRPRKTATEVATAARCLSAALACEDALPATASGKVQKEVLR